MRFFNRGDYYTLHGSDAVLAAKEVFMNASLVKYIGEEGNKIQSLALSKSNFEAFVRDLLLVKQYRVEVFVPKGGSAKNCTDWVVEYKVSVPCSVHLSL